MTDSIQIEAKRGDSTKSFYTPKGNYSRKEMLEILKEYEEWLMS